jgi:dTDP-glucose pyrophosphorylase
MAITMAGFGSRFAAAGYKQPKYQIEALGMPLFDWSMLSLQGFQAAGWRFSFAVRRADGAADFIRQRCSRLGIEVARLLELDAPTDGQATTALALAEAASPSDPFAVFNIDTFVNLEKLQPATIPPGCDGWIPCFPGEGDGWSFARTDEDGRVVELREKTRISPHATVGLYWFRSVSRYTAAYSAYFSAGKGEEKGERYIAPLYNQLLADGDDVRITSLELADVGLLGTPAQVEAFMRDPPPPARLLARFDQGGAG